MKALYSDEEKKLLRTLGEGIRQQRLLLGLSQEALAFASQLDCTYVGSVERGERNISMLNLHKIAAALTTTPAQLLLTS